MPDTACRRLSLPGTVLMLLALAACTGRGEVVIFDLAARPIPVRAVTEDPSPLRVAVRPTEFRTFPELWSREHLWGGFTYYTVREANVPAAVALTMVKHFREHGWQAWVEDPYTQKPQNPADVTLSGELEELSAKAASYLGRTHIEVAFRMTVTAANAADGSTMKMRLQGKGTDLVFWFDPSDIQKLVRTIVTESLDKFLAQTVVDNRTLRARKGSPAP